MTKIWGLDLGEIQWGKFKSSNMWNKIYYHRRTKFLIYQLAMILCVISESLGTDVLSKYISDQKTVERNSGGATTVHNNDIVGAFSFNIFVGVFVATIFGAAFFFDLFWPERREDFAVRVAWKACGVLACIFTLASALLLTVLLSTHQATLSGSPNGTEKFKAPLEYKKNRESIASVCLIWPGWLATIWSTVLLFQSLDHIEKIGPLSKIGRADRINDKDENPASEVNTEREVDARAGESAMRT